MKLPDEWKWVKLGDICDKAETINPLNYPDESFNYVDISSVDNIRKIITDFKLFSGKEAPSRARQLIKTNDVIVSTTRPNLNALAKVSSNLNGAVCSTGFCVLRANEAIDPNYIFYYVRTSFFVDALTELVQGALYPAVNDTQVRNQIIPLPPLEEQKRIVAILKEQMKAVEAARTAAQARLDAINSLPSSLLNQAFRGEL